VRQVGFSLHDCETLFGRSVDCKLP